TIEDIDAEEMACAARKGTHYGEKLTPGQRAWLRRVKLVARSVGANKYVDGNVDKAIRALKPLMASPEEVRNIPRVLAEYGIRLVIVEHLQQTRIDGACVWVDEHSPVVSLSMRYDRLDYFWFTLLHELGHIANRDGLTVLLAPDSDLVGDQATNTSEKPPIEQAADKFAEENLISPSEMDNFIARVRPLFSKAKILGFALRQGVHPGIVIGQLQHRGAINWSHSREFLVKVRDVIIGAALTDGWGQVLPNIA